MKNASETTNKDNSVLQAVKFTLFSLSAGVIQLGSNAIFTHVFGWESWWTSYLPALILSVLWNFTFNRKYTFKPTNHVARDMALVALYYAVFTPVSIWLGNWLEVLGIPDLLVTVIVMLLNFVTEFLFQKFVVYRGEADA
ncbi:MAG: GtrA family protein [Clostridiales bacterium]|nr:GtrA family protein [Clostridiales bacterium]